MTLMNHEELLLNLEDNEWPLTTIDHDRLIARAIVVDAEENFYFVRANRDDDFGKATLIETAGGGVEEGEDLDTAIRRELKEELGIEVEVLCKIGLVSDYYNLIHRHNINNYFLCKIVAFGEKHLTKDEIEDFHLSTLKLKYEDALAEYEKCRCTSLGRLVANREIPVLKRAKVLLDGLNNEPPTLGQIISLSPCLPCRIPLYKPSGKKSHCKRHQIIHYKKNISKARSS